MGKGGIKDAVLTLKGCSSSIRKFKHWQDAEYTVQGVQKAIMRLPVDQKYEEREGLASE